MRAEDLPGTLGRFRVIAFAASFHWMDRPKVAELVRTMLDRDGVAVQIDAPSYRCDALADAATTELPHPFPPDEQIVELRRRYLGPDTRAGQGIRNSSPDGEDAVFVGAGFAPALDVVVPDGRVLERTVDDLVAMRFSSSPTAPHLFGDRVGEFESDLRRILSEASSSGTFRCGSPTTSSGSGPRSDASLGDTHGLGYERVDDDPNVQVLLATMDTTSQSERDDRAARVGARPPAPRSRVSDSSMWAAAPAKPPSRSPRTLGVRARSWGSTHRA